MSNKTKEDYIQRTFSLCSKDFTNHIRVGTFSLCSKDFTNHIRVGRKFVYFVNKYCRHKNTQISIKCHGCKSP